MSVKEMRPRPTCDRKDCPNRPEWQIGFKIWAKGYTKTSTPIRGEIGLYLCDPCGRETRIEHVLTDQGFAIIALQARLMRRAEPDRASAEVELLPILGLERPGGAA